MKNLPWLIMPMIFLSSFSVLTASLLIAKESMKEPDGKTLFHEHCASCHGKEVVGEDPARPMGGLKADGTYLAPALNGTAHAWHHSPELLYRYLKHGSVSDQSPMPSFGDTLEDREIKAVIDYFQSLWPQDIRKKCERHFQVKLGSN